MKTAITAHDDVVLGAGDIVSVVVVVKQWGDRRQFIVAAAAAVLPSDGRGFVNPPPLLIGASVAATIL